MSTSENPLRQLEHFGQSVWLDYIRRHLLFSPRFRRMIDGDGLEGMTSNPTIFEKAIAGSTDYDEQFDAFDQPNVQESKDNTGRLLKEFERSGKLPVEAPAVEHGIVSVYCSAGTKSKITSLEFEGILKGFLKMANRGDYFAIMA